jgi:hypothetical protein
VLMDSPRGTTPSWASGLLGQPSGTPSPISPHRTSITSVPGEPPSYRQEDSHISIHLVIGPGGVFVVDSKLYTGKLHLAPDGSLWHGRYPLTPVLLAVRFEADQAAQVLASPGIEVVPLVAVHGAQVPWGKLVVGGVPVVGAHRLPELLRRLPAVLAPERVAGLANTARVRFHAAA